MLLWVKNLKRRIESSGYGSRPTCITGVDLQPVKYSMRVGGGGGGRGCVCLCACNTTMQPSPVKSHDSLHFCTT